MLAIGLFGSHTCFVLLITWVWGFLCQTYTALQTKIETILSYNIFFFHWESHRILSRIVLYYCICKMCVFEPLCIFLLGRASYFPFHCNNLHTYLIVTTEVQSSCRQGSWQIYFHVFPLPSSSSCAVNMRWIGWCWTECVGSFRCCVFSVSSQLIVLIWQSNLFLEPEMWSIYS